MSQTCLTSPARKQRTHLSEDAWRQVRREFESGRPVAALARHYDVHRSTLTRRRDAEGWRRALPAPLAPSPVDPTADAASLEEVVDRLLGEIVSSFNGGHREHARELAKATEIYIRLMRRPMMKGAASPAEAADDRTVFRPLQDVFEFIAEQGLTAEDYR